ncbi:uncharacterized protein [Panulirus ornatus]|uniref:uncharacterized protein n=1 Tax=Panulirus ornatus TaxID=150431 RepID=UPI003A8AC337
MKAFPVLVLAGVMVMAPLTDAYTVLLLTRLPREALQLPPGEGTVPITMNTGSFTAEQKGQAKTKTSSESDTSSGLTSSGLEAMLRNSGFLSGAANAVNDEGNASSSQYGGQLVGEGGLQVDTESVAADAGAGARTHMQGFISGDAAISGGVGAGATNQRHPPLQIY